MSSLTNQSSSSKSMTGLTDVYATDIITDNLEVTNSFTCDTGCVISLPNASIQDAFLTSNVAFRNQTNTFTQPNIFTNTVNFQGGGSETQLVQVAGGFGINNITSSRFVSISTKTGAGVAVGNIFCRNGNQAYLQGNSISTNRIDITGTQATIGGTSVPLITTQPSAGSATNEIASTAWTKSNFGLLTLASPTTHQTWFGVNRFSNSGANLQVSLRNTDEPTYAGGLFIASASGQFNSNTSLGDTCLLSQGTSASNTGALSLTTWSSTNCGIRITLNDVRINGTTSTINSACSFTSTTTPVITQSIPANDATTKISTTQWVDTYFGKLSGNQTWSGTNTFSNAVQFTSTTTPVITQAISLADNSTKIATTAFVKGQGYITSSALTPYALLAGTQTFSGVNTFTGVSIINNTAFYNNQTDARFISTTGEATQMYQTAAGFTITSISNGKFIALNTRDATGTIIVDGVVCRDGNRAYLQSNTNTVNRIDITGNQATIGGTLVPIMTTQPLTASNNNEIASTAFVKNQNYITATALTPYALLAPTALQTFAGTAQNTFNNQVNANAGVRFVDTFASKISQVGNALIIENISNVNSVQIRSTTAGLFQNTGLIIQNGNYSQIQGGLGNTITVSALNTPTLGIPPLAGVYSSEIATTSWVNTELTGVYARLDTAQTFAAQNTFTSALPIVIKNTVSANSGGLLITTAGAYNNINNAGDFAVVGFGATINTGTLNLTTWANTSCGIKIDNDTITQNAPFTCGYLQLGAPITSKTNFNIGYQWDIGGGGFTGTSWATAVGAYNIMTIAWNGTGDKTLGVWLCEVVIITNCSTAPAFSLCWNTISNTSMDISEKCTQSNLTTVFNAASHQITRLNFTLNITNFLQTFWLNSSKVGGAGLSSNTSFSQIKFTRIA